MRFLADGPCLPDELLVARDEGRVLFFCGAGVSRANAGLPDFLGLAKSVLRNLRVLPESPAQKLVDEAERLKPIPGVGGMLPADRIFGLLERQFSVADIDRAVGDALRPHDNVNLSAHRTLLALSRSAGGKVQLVTTNFDLLFEAAAPRKVPVWTPNSLPDLRGNDGFEGIVHLHGMFDASYTSPVGGNLVLSSAEFGRAYLAEGWATNFIRAAIRNYLIVFVGYAADDPPVQYLLEALNRIAGTPPHGLYAFQEGSDGDAKALWAQKGVRAIAYAPDNGHASLWATLNTWVDRARDPKRWHERLIRRARRGPQALQPHERGQIAHLAATEDGARSIALAKHALPASWLCVFDPATRYGPPGKTKPLEPNSPDVDPFTDYALDSDPPPLPAKRNQRREIPADSFDAFAPNLLDRRIMGGHFRGYEGPHTSELSSRLASLAEWLARVCGEPAAVWWVSDQAGLHPAVIRQIEYGLNQSGRALPTLAHIAWQYVFEGLKTPPEPDYVDIGALKDAIARDGWTKQHVRHFASISRSKLTVSRSYLVGPIPPRTLKWPRLRDLINLDIRYPEINVVRFDIPDAQLYNVIPALRRNLEYAVDLVREIDLSALFRIPTIEPDPNLIGTLPERDSGINAIVLDFTNLFRRLVEHDKESALRELAAWRQHDDPVFGRLRVWAARLGSLLDDAFAGEVLANLDDATFWGSYDRPDLLLSLRQRWHTMPADIMMTIEKRLLQGPPTIEGVSGAGNRHLRAIAILDRVIWLRDQGCCFATDVEANVALLRKVVPQWTPAEAAGAAASQESRGGRVRIDTPFKIWKESQSPS